MSMNVTQKLIQSHLVHGDIKPGATYDVHDELSLRAVLAKVFARIHSQNLINFGVLPLTFVDPADYDGIQAGDVLCLTAQ